MSDYSGEVLAEVLAERALVRPQIIPLVPLTNQYHMDHKDYKSKVSAWSPKSLLGLLVVVLRINLYFCIPPEVREDGSPSAKEEI